MQVAPELKLGGAGLAHCGLTDQQRGLVRERVRLRSCLPHRSIFCRRQASTVRTSQHRTLNTPFARRPLPLLVRLQVQRFDPRDADTIGFFVCKFVKD